MRKLAVAQLGSEEIDQIKFVELLAIKTVKVLLSDLYEKLSMDEVAEVCKAVTTLGEARIAADFANETIHTTYAVKGNRAACAVTDAIFAAANAVDLFAANALGYAADTAARATARATALAAALAAYTSARATARAAGNAADCTVNTTVGKDYYLKLSAGLALECLQELNSPGCEFLYLCEV
jgi:hypothetical protein